ncbi:uncharacterized protein LOC127755238 isoform X1 [Oryza glaberrima]|uniref:Rab-GAP TBC domain-containing protein n=1 Tax=Oryza glaberrima TaxID=4538 RepID=I1R055_ORYGL|nr:uncharacterized protein LOC127755238 isoform X1 [Oryza glaberrima]
MRKKPARAVPEWLNSPLWSAPPPSSSSPSPPVPPDPYGADLSPPPPPPPKPPPPPTVPPPSYEQAVGSSRRARSEAGWEEEEDGEVGGGAALRAHLLADFKLALSKKVVNMGELRRLACLGVPDGGAAVRPLVWKLLLGYLPTERAFWPHELEKKRSQYSAYKDEFLLNPSEKIRRFEESKLLRKKELNSDKIGLLPRAKVTNEEHPLSFGKSSLWNQYFQESEILEQIDRDVKRTHPEMPFFSAKANQESLRRILIIFSKLNPTIRYVQGMNEVLAPLFYVFKNDPDTSNSASAEADTFFCFVELLSGFKDNYCKHLDNSQVGIRSTLSKLSQLLKRHDEELWRHMEITTKVYPQYYAFRWITLLLTMEFSFNVCIHIWDAILGDPEGPPDTLLRICCAMLILVRRRLLAGDFTANIQLLQHYPPTNIDHLLHIANRLRGSVAS